MTWIRTKEYREKMRQAKLRNPTRYWLGKKMSEEARKKIKLARNLRGTGYHIHTEKHKEQLREKMLGNKLGLGNKSTTGLHWKLTEKTKKRMSEARKGWKPSDETRARMSKNRKGKGVGEACSLWRGGLTSLSGKIRKCDEYIFWRVSVYKRDNYTCIWCGDNKGNNLQADHIKPFALILYQNNIKTMEEAINCSELWDIHNGRTLCKECHETTDTYAWRTSSLIKKLSK